MPRSPTTTDVDGARHPGWDAGGSPRLDQFPAPGNWLVRLRDFVVTEPLVITILVAAFLARLFLAGWNSYWLDELYSVELYVVQHPTASEAIRSLAETSVHPPLYQWLLYHWIAWFGDTEAVTRTLSNLYITLAGLFLFLMVRSVYSRRVAIGTTAAFAVMHTPMYYGLETRSYAQTILLVTVSSYLLLRLMIRLEDHSWRSALRSPLPILFILTNAAVLLTHYYNVFFWFAQGGLAGIYVLLQWRRRQWLAGLGAVAVMYAVQGMIFVLFWGSEFVDDLRGRADDYVLEGAARAPWELLESSVLRSNVTAPPWLILVGAALLLFLLTRAVVTVAQRDAGTVERREAWASLYLTGWMVLPLVIVWAGFSLAGVARYSDRYFVFAVVPLAPLIVFTIDETFRLVRSTVFHRPREAAERWIAPCMAVIVAATLLPGGYEAATAGKHDLRGAAQTIVAIAEANPDASYVVYEPAFRTTPILDYYLRRFSDEIRVTGTIRRSEERRGENFGFERSPEVVAAHDYLIVPFTHHRVTDFPNALARLEELYRVHHRQIDDDGRGVIIYASSWHTGE
jgi:uncharacterized membrane protein